MLLLVLKISGLLLTAIAGLYGLGRNFRDAAGQVTPVGYVTAIGIVAGTLLATLVELIEASKADASSREQRKRMEQVVTQLERVADPIGQEVMITATWSLPSAGKESESLVPWIKSGRLECRLPVPGDTDEADHPTGCLYTRNGPPPDEELEAYSLNAWWLLQNEPPNKEAERLVARSATTVALMRGEDRADALQRSLETNPETLFFLGHRGSGGDTLVEGDLGFSLPGWSEEDVVSLGIDLVEDLVELTHQMTTYSADQAASNARVVSHRDLRDSYVFLALSPRLFFDDQGRPLEPAIATALTLDHFSISGDGRYYGVDTEDFEEIRTPDGFTVYRAGPLGDYVR